MIRTLTRALVVVAALAAAAFYLHDPPWVGDLTYGFGPWITDTRGERLRWTMGRGSFFVPSDATSMTLKLRPHEHVPPETIAVDIRVDDRPLAIVMLPNRLQPDPDQWIVNTFPLPRRQTRRQFRRVDIRVRHGLESFYLGVHLGAITIERPSH